MVVSECDYPSNYDGSEYFNTEDHPIECATCELVIHALENWLIDPADEQAVRKPICIFIHVYDLNRFKKNHFHRAIFYRLS